MIKFLRHLVVDDLWLKLFSLVLAILFWLTVSVAIQHREASPIQPLASATEVRTFYDLPVIVLSSAADVRSFKVSPSEVEVTVRGTPRVLEDIHSKDIRAMVDLTGVEAAHNLRKRVEVSAPAGVTYVSARPEEVEVIIPAKSPSP